MQISLIIGLSIIGIIILASIVIILLKRKKVQSPIITRAQNILIIINQKIYATNHKIAKLDKEITNLIMVQEKNDTSLLTSVGSIENIPELIEKNKEKVDYYISELRDLKQYKNNIESLLKAKKEAELQELEKLLDEISEKIKQMF